MKTAIIGCGGMGKLFAREFKKHRDSITVSDINPAKAECAAIELGINHATNEEAIKCANEVVLSTALLATPEIIDKYHPLFTIEKTVYDIASVKYLNSKGVSIVDKLRGVEARTFSCHPMVGPSADNFNGCNIALIPTNDRSPIEEYVRFFRDDLGANAIVMENGDAHDMHMSYLALGHMIGFISAGAIAEGPIPLSCLRACEGTTSLVNRVLAEFILSSSADTYAAIQIENKYALANLNRIRDSVTRFRTMVERKDYAGFKSEMEDLREYFKLQDPEYGTAIRRKFIQGVEAMKKAQPNNSKNL